MRTIRLTIAATGLALCLMSAPDAYADFGFELNGPYEVTSNGDWAKTNEKYRDEVPVREIWTFSTSCVDAHTCSGTVNSNAGWSAPVEFRTTRWILDRYHEQWEPCPDGTFSPGRQRYQFQPADANGQIERLDVRTLMGYDRTIGISGACGINTPLVISIPLTLRKL